MHLLILLSRYCHRYKPTKKTADAIYADGSYPAPLVRANQMEDLKKFITALTPDKQVEFLGSLASVG